MKRISVYVRNKELTPSSYYRIVQYTKGLEGNVIIREIAPKLIYKLKRNSSNRNTVLRFIVDFLYYAVMLFRVSFYLIVDNLILPDCVILSKTFCPKYSPLFLLGLIKNLIKRSKLYWDFDDYIFISGEISKSQKKILEVYSKNIIVTNDFLKAKINPIFQDKVHLMPTTDGDLQGFDPIQLMKERTNTFQNEVRLVWVATSGNIRHILRVIDSLDTAGEELFQKFHKQLILTVICDKPIDCKTRNLVIRNIPWTRDIAKEEIYCSHIGIMPLIEDEYTRGKGGFKLVQYISTGLPVLASDVGYNKEVVGEKCGILVEDTEDTKPWIDAVLKLSIDTFTWCEFSESAYSQWSERFSFSKNMAKWNQLIQS
ncbi:glycosyltransferase [Bacillus sp. EB600]|uniref:glycosyltransferase n=1 Tax=Bacillus sp. EB600 TaxID=2806345 RepID=UPI0021098075|nr:glycosyltransferase [Bacillus sp. EB600]MCQ6280005.1 glycosyltransferase [Bacillus sp. EB600]